MGTKETSASPPTTAEEFRDQHPWTYIRGGFPDLPSDKVFASLDFRWGYNQIGRRMLPSGEQRTVKGSDWSVLYPIHEDNLDDHKAAFKHPFDLEHGSTVPGSQNVKAFRVTESDVDWPAEGDLEREGVPKVYHLGTISYQPAPDKAMVLTVAGRLHPERQTLRGNYYYKVLNEQTKEDYKQFKKDSTNVF